CSYRKKCLLYNDLLMIVAASIMGCSKIAQSFEMILIGRFMCGISAGKRFLPQVSRLS
ncbi:Solute carrier family 2, facilitated glucose transporter member 5, partial [Spheniscus humboldti]